MPQSKSRRSHYRPLYSCKITKLKPILCHFRHALETSPILVKAKDGAAPAAAASWGHGRTIAALLLCCCHRFTWQLKSFSIPWCSPPRTKTSWWSTGSAEHLHGALHGAHGESSQKWFLVRRIILKKNVRCVQSMLPLPDDVKPIRTCDMNALIEGDFSHVLMFNCSDYSVLMCSIPDHVLEQFILGIFLGFLLGVPPIFHVCSTYVPPDSFRTHLAICSSARQRSGPQASPPGTSIVFDRNTWRTLKHIEQYWTILKLWYELYEHEIFPDSTIWCSLANGLVVVLKVMQRVLENTGGSLMLKGASPCEAQWTLGVHSKLFKFLSSSFQVP